MIKSRRILTDTGNKTDRRLILSQEGGEANAYTFQIQEKEQPQFQQA